MLGFFYPPSPETPLFAAGMRAEGDVPKSRDSAGRREAGATGDEDGKKLLRYPAASRRGTSFRLDEEEIKKTYLQYKNIASVEVSSAVVFAALSHFKFKPSDKIVFINSGKMK